MKTKTFFLSLILLCTGWANMPSVQAQDTDFWFVVPHLHRSGVTGDGVLDRPVYFMVIAGDEPATVTMEMPAFTGFYNRVLNLAAHESRRIIFGDDNPIYSAFADAQLDTIQNNILNSTVGVKNNRGIHFTATAQVTIYYQADGSGSKDMFALKGSKALGTEFYTSFQTLFSSFQPTTEAYPQFHIVATEDNTTVTITPKTNIVGTAAGQSKIITMNSGETFAARTVNFRQGVVGNPATWLAGSHIEADKPVAVTIADDMSTLENDADLVGDQIVPINNLGTTYIVIRGFAQESDAYCDKIFVLATQNGTNISVNGNPVATSLAVGEQYYFSLKSTHTAVVESNLPVYVFHLSGFGNSSGTEAGAALLPSMYSINSRRITFHKNASAYNHHVFVLVRDGNEGYFTVNGNAAVLQASDFTSVPNMAGWKYARKSISSVANGSVVVNNSKGAFSLGYFNTGSSAGSSASFGYFSQYGSLSFPDIIYKCAGTSITLDGGYAKSYQWTLPDGATATTPTITVTDTGRYTVVVDQDPFLITATTVVMDRFIRSAIVSSGGNDVGAGAYTYSVDLQQSATNVSYVWKVDGAQVSTDATYSTTWTNDDEHLITVELTDDVLGCTKTLSYVHHKMPDNMSDASCFITVPPIEWSFKEITSSNGTGALVDNSCVPLVGDIDNDGKTEIVVFEKGFHAQYVDMIHIFETDENNQLTIQQKIATPVINRVNNPYAIAKVDNNEYAALFFCTSHYANTAANVAATNGADARQLMKYVYNPVSGEYEFSWKKTYSAQINREMGQPIIVDFNGDGVSEVLVFDKIFNAQTGALLVDGGLLSDNNNGFGFGGHLISIGRWVNGSETTWSSIMAVGDIDGDNLPEVIGGKTVYKVAINNPNSQDGTNTFEVLRHVNTTNHPEAVDGATAIADMDGDGLPDVVVAGRRNVAAGLASLYVWNPRTGAVMHDNVINNIPAVQNEHSASVPFIGDIDGDGKPEICLTGKAVTKAFEFDATARSLTQKWSIVTNDTSAATGMTMFDFDQDGAQEIVYRDMTHLRILNGVNGSNKIPPIPCKSSTGNEYPVVVDVNGDNAAEIVVTSGFDGAGNETNGFLRIFGSATTDNKWAPARKVWNQYAYNVVNINDNLTVPKFQMNPATVFLGEDGIPGTADDTRPYNGYLQQQTSLSYNGTPLWLTPDAKFAETPVATYHGDGDSLVISTKLTNIGDAALIATFYISAYKNTVDAANKMATDSSMISLNVNHTVNATVVIRRFSDYLPLTNIVIQINDQGEAAYVQLECDDNNNTYDYDPAGLPKAANDTVATLINNEVTIAVHSNDTPPASGCPSPGFTIATDPTKGVADLVGDQIKYTPQTDFYGVDSLIYRLTCTTGKTEAKVYIVVNKPTAPTYIGCAGTDVTAGFEHIDNVEYLWYDGETGGTTIDVARDTRPCTAPSEWWVEAQYKGKPVALRFKVTVAAYQPLTPVSIEKDDTICYGEIPVQLKATNNPSGGDGSYSYRWQQSPNGVDGWTDTDSTDRTFTPPALTSDTYYRLNTTSCTTEPSNVVKIKVYPQSLYNYPDLRIRVCPDAGALINLSKYIDTLAVESILWKSVAPPLTITDPTTAGTIAADHLNEYTNVYTLTYTVDNPCLSSPVERKVYLERLKNGRMRPLRDTVVVCFELAERLQLNQIFGIDAAGTWSFDPAVVDVSPYITRLTSPTYNGAVIMNGKAIYGNNTGNVIVKVTYKPGDNSCLKGKSYTITIILTPDMMK